MENIMACRICLAMDVKLYNMWKNGLKSAYENITGTSMSHNSLQVVCSFCAAMLDKVYKFQQRCTTSHVLLETLVAERAKITPDKIKSINRKTHNLAYPYTTETVHNYDFVTIKEEINDNIKPEIKNIIDDYEYELDATSNTYDDNEIPFINNLSNDLNIIKEDEYSNKNNDCVNNVINDNDKPTHYNDNKITDSDEEPLSKKVKKKKRFKNRKTKKRFKSFAENLCKSTDDANIDTLSQNKDDKLKVNLTKYAEHGKDNEHEVKFLTRDEQLAEVLSRKDSSNYKNSVYKCGSCYKGFITEATYKNHMNRHDPLFGPVVCEICHTRWPDTRALKAHAATSHERRYTCRACGNVCKSKHKAKEHTGWHRGVVFPCGRCGQVFDRSVTLLSHARSWHAARHACPACGDTFLGARGLAMHRKRAHAARNTTHTHGVKDTEMECDTCSVKFNNKAALTRHTEQECRDHLFPCLECGEHFPSRSLLDAHASEHYALQKTCTQCSRTFAHARSLALHVARVHAHARGSAREREGAVCELCGYTCGSKSTLIAHQRIHSGERPFECDICQKRFSLLQRLQIHTRTHTNERPFQCSSCPKAFKHKAALNRHTRVHTGTKPYVCPLCGKSFSQSNSMKKHCAGVHMKIHIYPKRSDNKQNA